jgi:hypothetical protein
MRRAYPEVYQPLPAGRPDGKEGAISEERERRVGLNESIFRQVNEQILSLGDELGVDDGAITVICECGDAGCTKRLEVPLSDYERVRQDSVLYLVASGHELPDVEQVVERHDSWQIVRKVGAASEVAEETDPRS